MVATVPEPTGFARIFAWRRVRPALIAAFVVSVIWSPAWTGSYPMLLGRLATLAMVQLFVFGLFERWPRRLPRWLARWPLQVAAVAFVVPFSMAIIYALTTHGDPEPWYHNKERMAGYSILTFFGLLIGPWAAMAGLYRHVSGQAQRQALAFQLERSELERQALDSRMRVLQAQVEPHFLFNTLANIRELVDSGSPQASAVLASLIAYLRAAVPRLHDTTSTFRQELELVRAYLEVMHMRMPDRLAFALDADDAALALECPPMALLTLVENAVRHGIDPGEEGGRIEVRVAKRDGLVSAQVIDTGVGMGGKTEGLGTGLANLRERLKLAYGDAARLRLIAVEPHGTCAEIEFPAQVVRA
jgi:hypothetical protein